MQDENELISLIDAASAKAGSDSNLARQIGQPPQRISNWRKGRDTCPPEDQALMAAVAGLDPMQTLIRATVRKHEGKAKGDLLMKVLGKLSPVTGAVAGFVGAVLLLISSMTPGNADAGMSAEPALDNVYYVKCRSHRGMPQSPV